MNRLPACLAALLLIFHAGGVRAEAGEPGPIKIHFNVINKISGRSSPLGIYANEFSSFDKLQIFPARCVRVNEGDKPAYAALLEVYETSLSKTPMKLFSGWLFSESHSLTNIENQYYDLLLESCDLPKEEEQTAPVVQDNVSPPPDTPPPTPNPIPLPPDLDVEHETPLD